MRYDVIVVCITLYAPWALKILNRKGDVEISIIIIIFTIITIIIMFEC